MSARASDPHDQPTTALDPTSALDLTAALDPTPAGFEVERFALVEDVPLTAPVVFPDPLELNDQPFDVTIPEPAISETSDVGLPDPEADFYDLIL